MKNIELITVDNDIVTLDKNKVVGPGSRFDGRIVKNNKDIMEIFGEKVGEPNLDQYKMGDPGEEELYRAMIEVFKGNITGPQAQQIMEAAQGEFPLDFIAKEQMKYMKQPKASGGTPDTRIMPDGRIIGPQSRMTKPMDMRKMLLANITGLI
tara:strand:+ start:106 stop:561 length:456 start_codon:yes stop_codon:yes gene_type:complete